MKIALDGARTRATESECNAWQVMSTQYYQNDIFCQIGDFTFKTATFLKGPN